MADFQNVARSDLEAALPFARSVGVPYYVHAELPDATTLFHVCVLSQSLSLYYVHTELPDPVPCVYVLSISYPCTTAMSSCLTLQPYSMVVDPPKKTPCTTSLPSCVTPTTVFHMCSSALTHCNIVS